MPPKTPGGDLPTFANNPASLAAATSLHLLPVLNACRSPSLRPPLRNHLRPRAPPPHFSRPRAETLPRAHGYLLHLRAFQSPCRKLRASPNSPIKGAEQSLEVEAGRHRPNWGLVPK